MKSFVLGMRSGAKLHIESDSLVNVIRAFFGPTIPDNVPLGQSLTISVESSIRRFIYTGGPALVDMAEIEYISETGQKTISQMGGGDQRWE